MYSQEEREKKVFFISLNRFIKIIQNYITIFKCILFLIY
jgi:hypothetical protein